jgi:hypothetical protein
MTKLGWVLGAAILGLALLAPTSVGRSASSTVDYAGNVLAVDATTGRIAVGDMGPLLDDGRSDITRRSILVTSATEFTKRMRIGNMNDLRRRSPLPWAPST